MYGKSSCSSSAPSSTKVSKTSLRTSSGRASGRSILLMTTIGRICWRTPCGGRTWSAASALRRRRPARGQPSAIWRVRSTSPPKSAWPGVSMMLILVDAVIDRDVLGEDRDAALALLVVGVEDAVAHELAGPELAGLAEHGVDQRGLAVVDVGDDRHIADVVATRHGVESAGSVGRACAEWVGRMPGRSAGTIEGGGVTWLGSNIVPRDAPSRARPIGLRPGRSGPVSIA